MQPTFAQIRAEVAARRHDEAVRPHLLDSDGSAYFLVEEKIHPARAVELVQVGAVVAFDPCGCLNSRCGLRWLTISECSLLARSGVPELHSKRADGQLSSWRSGSSDLLVLAQGWVRWGSQLS